MKHNYTCPCKDCQRPVTVGDIRRMKQDMLNTGNAISLVLGLMIGCYWIIPYFIPKAGFFICSIVFLVIWLGLDFTATYMDERRRRAFIKAQQAGGQS